MSPTGWTETRLDEPGDIGRLRRQRNWLGVATVVIVAAGMAVSLPRALERRARLRSANAELLQLQGELVSLQQRIGSVQTEIRGVQDQIHALAAVRQ